MAYKIDFKMLAKSINITGVAKHLNLVVKKGRAACPVCKGSDQRDIQIYEDTNSFRCHSAEKSGDCISLYAHVKGVGQYQAAVSLQQLIGASAPTTATAPKKTEDRTASAQPAPTFDPQAFAAKLAYSPEIEAMGLSEENARRLAIGFYRKKIYLAIRDEEGEITGFAEFANGQLRLPDKWLTPSNVVPIRRAK